MRRNMSSLSIAIVCGSVALLGACTRSEDGASMPRAAPSVNASASAIAAPGMKDLQRALLTREDVASAMGTSANGIREMTGAEALEVSRIVSVEGCAGAGGTSGPSGLSGHWQAGVFYTFLDGDRGTDVIECITAADQQTIERMVGGGAAYDPAPIGTDVIGYEVDGGAGAIDRVVVVEDDGVVIVVIANRHSPVPEGENLTRSQVDRLVATAVANLDTVGHLLNPGP
jgi:hypothetical protein